MWGQSYQFPCKLPQPNIERPKKKKIIKKKKKKKELVDWPIWWRWLEEISHMSSIIKASMSNRKPTERGNGGEERWSCPVWNMGQHILH